MKDRKNKLALLGSTGFLGKVLLQKALDRGYQIKTLVRNPERLGDFKKKVIFIIGNEFNKDDIEKTVEGTEVVISTIGPTKKDSSNTELYKKRMEELINVLEHHNIKRYIHIGGAAHLSGEDENWSTGRKLLRFILNIFAKPILIAKQLEWEVLKISNLDWTLIRPPCIIKGKFKGKGIIADEKNLARTRVNVEELASFILDQTESSEWIRKAPLVASEK